MSSHSDFAVQKAVYEYLCGQSALTALLGAGAGGVRDPVTPDVPFPYIVLGDIQSADFSAQALGARQVALTLHVYSKAEGSKETREILKALHAALEGASFGIDGHILADCRASESTSALLADGKTREGRLRALITTHEE